MFYFSIQEVKKIQVVDNLMYVLNREVRENWCWCYMLHVLMGNFSNLKCMHNYVKFLDLINSIRIIRECRAVIKWINIIKVHLCITEVAQKLHLKWHLGVHRLFIVFHKTGMWFFRINSEFRFLGLNSWPVWIIQISNKKTIAWLLHDD